MRRDNLQQLAEDPRVARNYVTALQIRGVTFHVAYQSTCFGDEEATRGHIPRGQPELPESVVTSSRHKGQVQCGGTGAADAGGSGHEVLEHGQIGFGMREFTKRKAGPDQAIGELGTLAYP